MEKEEVLKVYRHSLAHILAKAVIELYGKEVQYAIGPEIEDGCYYDFVLPRTVTEEDFQTIEDKMHEIIKRREDWTRKVISRDEALELFKDQKFKHELIVDLPADETISIYYTGDDYVDLCRGPHVDNSQELFSAAFKIKNVSGAYWRGDEKRDQLQRIYLFAFPSKDELKAHLAWLKEAQERDHKKIGTALDLFMFRETAPGMAYWLPRGWILYQELMKYSREIQGAHGYTEISAPLINNKKLWLISGHWAHYQNNMFIVPGITKGVNATDAVQGEEAPEQYAVDAEDTMAAKPMNCPNAMMSYKRTMHSYKELPIRYSEYDVLHRKEKSGQMNGLFRVQEFRQDDDHTFVTPDQIKDEIKDVIAIADEIYKTFGITYRAEFSTRPDDFMGDIESWNSMRSMVPATTRSTKATAHSTARRSTFRSRTLLDVSGSAVQSSSTSSSLITSSSHSSTRTAHRRCLSLSTEPSSVLSSVSSASSQSTSRALSRSGSILIRLQSFLSDRSTMSMHRRLLMLSQRPA